MLLQILNWIEQYPIHEQIIWYILVYSILIWYICIFVLFVYGFINFIKKL